MALLLVKVSLTVQAVKKFFLLILYGIGIIDDNLSVSLCLNVRDLCCFH